MASASSKPPVRLRLERQIAEILTRLQAQGYTGRLTIAVDFNQGGITGAVTSESRRLDLK
jgi:hypothetical protein